MKKSGALDPSRDRFSSTVSDSVREYLSWKHLSHCKCRLVSPYTILFHVSHLRSWVSGGTMRLHLQQWLFSEWHVGHFIADSLEGSL
jgi:hypothetical protein